MIPLALSLALAAYSFRTLHQARLERERAENFRDGARKVLRAALVIKAQVLGAMAEHDEPKGVSRVLPA